MMVILTPLRNGLDEPDGIEHLLAVRVVLRLLLSRSHKHVPILRRAALYAHEFIKLENAPVAACVALAPLVEKRMSGVIDALLVLPDTV